MLKGWTGSTDCDFAPRIALQSINESALCINRVRRKSSLSHQGFQIANGMSKLVTDEQVHKLLDKHTVKEAEELLITLGHQRQLNGHYQGDIIAIDPHRIISTSQRIMPKKNKMSNEKPKKTLQTFFSLSVATGQPIMAYIGSSGMPVSKATQHVIAATGEIIRTPGLIMADKEHFTFELLKMFSQHEQYDILTPVRKTKKLEQIVRSLSYQPLWAGYAVAETKYAIHNQQDQSYRMIVQRKGGTKDSYDYDAFITTSAKSAEELLSINYPERWSIEEFFRFENKMGLNRMGTHNLNIRYGKLALSMMAQASIYQFRSNLKGEYRKWNAEHLANEIFGWLEGDIRVVKDTILVTIYNAPDFLKKEKYINLPEQLQQENIDPRIPWLYDLKLDFRFK